jgi:hypothetical protein
MAQRGITLKEIEEVLRNHRVIEEYPQETPYPEQLLVGWIGARALHIVVANDEQAGDAILVTVYDPDPNLWEEGFTKRRGSS